MQKNATTTLHLGDQAALNRRAERFQREHELERQKSLRNGSQSALKTNSQGAHLLNRIWRADSPSTFGPNPDDPEADPVSLIPSFLVTDRQFITECTQLGPPYHRWDKPGAVQRLPPTHIGEGRASHS
jgi:hypothetical protein